MSRGASDEIADASLARINELGLLDDREYARRRALLMAERGYGDYAIRLFLKGLGIPEGMADESVRRISEELSEHKRMALIIEKKRGLPKKKLIRFLAARGFSLDQIMDEIGGVDE